MDSSVETMRMHPMPGAVTSPTRPSAGGSMPCTKASLQSPEFSSNPSGSGINRLSCRVSAPAGGSLDCSALTTGLSGAWIPDTTRSLRQATQRQGCKNCQNPPFHIRDELEFWPAGRQARWNGPAGAVVKVIVHGKVLDYESWKMESAAPGCLPSRGEFLANRWSSVPGVGRSKALLSPVTARSHSGK
jgi:hypothetical protein